MPSTRPILAAPTANSTAGTVHGIHAMEDVEMVKGRLKEKLTVGRVRTEKGRGVLKQTEPNNSNITANETAPRESFDFTA